ncbi:MAG: ATP-grasp domain-containing protein [Planctomycetota bacterium]|nr:ATP-grasp domain-containing protein [Planctomycetota bacterium]
MSLRIALLETRDEGLAGGDDRDAIAVRAAEGAALALERACRANGWSTVRVEARADAPDATLAELARAEVDVVFQLVESLRGEARFEAAAAWLLEWARIPYTGSGPVAITLALEKPIARAVLQSRGVPIPEGFVLEHAEAAIPISLAGRRWIVKPAREDASHGIDAGSVVDDESSLRARAQHVLRTFRQPALVEEYVDGREFNVALLGSGPTAEVLPLGEIDYSRLDPSHPAVLTYAAKWDEASVEYHATPSIGARPMARELEERIRATARAAYAALGLAGYGRVDLRVSARGEPFVIDVNPNPDLSPDAGFQKAAARAGLDHAHTVRRIVDDALRRAGALA